MSSQNKANFATINAASLVNIKAFHVNTIAVAQLKKDARLATDAENAEFEEKIKGLESVPAEVLEAHTKALAKIDADCKEVCKEKNASIKTLVSAVMGDNKDCELYKAYAEYHVQFKGENHYKAAISDFLKSIGVESGDKGLNFMLKSIKESCGEKTNGGNALLESGQHVRILKVNEYKTLVMGKLYDILKAKGIIVENGEVCEISDKAYNAEEAKNIEAEQVVA